MKQPSIKKNIALSSLYQILNIILPIITAPYVSRVLGAEGIGIYSYTSSINTYFLMFATLGTTTYGAREIARVREDKKTYSKLFWEIEVLTILTTIITLVVWIAMSLAYKEYRLILLIQSIAIIGNLFEISWFFNGLEQFQYIVYRNAFFKIIGVISIFIFVNSSNDLILYITLMTVTTFMSNVSMWYKVPTFVEKVNFRDLDILPHFRQTLVYFIPTIATSVYNVLDKTMIGIFTDNMSQNGYYDQANKIITPLKTICFAALNGVLTSRISYLFAKKQYGEIKKFIDLSLEYIIFMGIGILFGLIGVSKNFVPNFFGEGYEPVVIILMIFSPVVLIIGLSNCLGAQYYTPSGRRKDSSKYIIVGAILNFVLNLLLIPKFGAIGASISTVAAELIITIMYVANSRGYVTFKVVIKKSAKKMLAGLLMLAVLVGIDSLISQKLLALSIQVILGSLTYFIVLTILKDKSVRIVLDKVMKR